MAYGIKKSRRWAWLAEVFRRARARRLANALLVLVAGFTLFTLWWSHKLSMPPSELSPWPSPASVPAENASFSAASALDSARALIKTARTNEYRGKIGEVADLWREALALLDRISRAAPGFQAAEVEELTRQCEDKLRKAK